MEVVRSFDSLKQAERPVVLAAGFFDGLHRGHLKVLSATLQRSEELDGLSWVFTFGQHPRRVVDPESAPALLTSTSHKLKLLDRLGVHTCMLIPFTRNIARIPAEEFVNNLLSKTEHMAEIVVGRNWRYGRGGEGDTDLLFHEAKKRDVAVKVIRGAVRKGRMVSSTRIRKAVREGDLQEAEAMLGRPFSVFGRVVRGSGIGREIGFPTANLQVENEILPPDGVYAAFAVYDGKLHKAAASLGVRPTFEKKSGPAERVLEVHLLDDTRNLYGYELEVFFVTRLRELRKYAATAALVEQIRRDARDAAKKLASKKKERIALHI